MQKLWTSSTQLIIFSTVINQGIVETTAFDFPGKFFFCFFFCVLSVKHFNTTKASAQMRKYFAAEVQGPFISLLSGTLIMVI